MFEIVQGDKRENNPGREKYKTGKEKKKKGDWERDEGMNGMVETTDFRRIKPVDRKKGIRSCKFDIDLGLLNNIHLEFDPLTWGNQVCGRIKSRVSNPIPQA